MNNMYISPTGSGNKSGSDAANAAPITSLDSMIVKAGAGGNVLLLADQGSYSVTRPIDIKHGGTESAAVTIKGVSSSGAAMDVVIEGSRNPVYTAGMAAGNELFKFQVGANNLVMENMTIKNVGTAFRAAGDVQNITIQHVDADNVQRFFEDTIGGSNKTATVTGLTIRDVDVDGFSKGVVRLGYNSSNILIEDVNGDSQGQAGDEFAIGIHLEGTTHDVIVRRTTIENATDVTGDYWNGDGFATERKVYNVLFEDTISRGNTDGGYDLKSTSTTLLRTIAEDNSRNYRIWGEATMEDVVGLNPNKRGGVLNNQNQVWISDDAKLTIDGAFFADAGTRGSVFDSEGGTVTMNDVEIIYAGKVTSGEAVPLTDAVITQVPAQGPASIGADFTPQIGTGDAETVSPAYTKIAATAASETITATDKAEMFVYAAAKTGTDTIKGFGANDLLVTKDALADGNGDGLITFNTSTGLKLSAANGLIKISGADHGLRLLGHTDEGYIYGNADAWAAGTKINPATLTHTGGVAPVAEHPGSSIGGTTPVQTHKFVSTAANETFTATAGSDVFYFDQASKLGADTVKGFGADDLLVTSKALKDSNGDGLIHFGKDLKLDLGSGAGTVGFDHTPTGIRYLGKTAEGYVYGDETVRPKGAKEGLLGSNDTLKGGTGDKALDKFFFDTAIDQSFGADKLTNFGGKDVLVTTTQLGAAGAATISANAGTFDLDGHGSLGITDASGRAVTTLEFDGDQVVNGTHYYVYSLEGSSAGLDHLMV